MTGRLYQQRHLDVIGQLLQLYGPGCSNVRRILQARIPIIKYNQDYTGIECDLSMTNMSGVYMSELLYLYGAYDARVKPLVFTIRKWAQCMGLTNTSPGHWITNFPLTLMVLFFLQQKTTSGAVLPPLKYLIDVADKTDTRITEDKINCTFARDLNKLPLWEGKSNERDLGSLLLEFFEFYSLFDFEDKAITIIDGSSLRKRDHSCLYIVNPLEPILNVSKNVNFEELERLRVAMRMAAWHLESTVTPNADQPWGIMQLFEPRGNKSVKNLLKHGNSQRLVSVSDIFDNDSDTLESKQNDEVTNDKFNDIKEDIKQLKSEPVRKNIVIYKNNHIRNEVRRIRRDSAENIKNTIECLDARDNKEDASRVRITGQDSPKR